MAMTPSELKRHVENAGHDSHFFDRASMRFFGDTMRNYGCCWSDRYGCWELYRKRPVKHGLKDSAYFDAESFARIFPDKAD